MDFQDTPELAAFRSDVKAWLAANATRRTDKLHMGMEGEAAFLEAKEWYKKKAEAGFACLTWPKEYGGAGLTSAARGGMDAGSGELQDTRRPICHRHRQLRPGHHAFRQ